MYNLHDKNSITYIDSSVNISIGHFVDWFVLFIALLSYSLTIDTIV